MTEVFPLIGLCVVISGLGLVVLSLLEPPGIFEPLVRNNAKARPVLNFVGGLLALLGILGLLVTVGAATWKAWHQG
jgi:hypothetical protein